MAPKRSAHLDDPPSASSDEDETEEEEQETVKQKKQESSSDEDSDEETTTPVRVPLEKHEAPKPKSKSSSEVSSEEESEEEEEDEEEETVTPAKNPVEKPKAQQPNLSSESESEADPDVSSPTASAFTVKPSKTDLVQDPVKPSSKRPAEADTTNRKKNKVSNGEVEDGKKSATNMVEDGKKSAIKMVWTDDNEIALLKGFLDYQSEKGCSPSSDIEGFRRFIVDSLSGNASTNQVYDKLRRLKKKYRTNAEKGGGNGEDPVFSKPHDHKLFELSKKIWGNDGSANRVNGKPKPKKEVKDEQSRSKKEVKDEKEEEVDKDEVRNKSDDFETMYPYWYAGLQSNTSPYLSFPDSGMEFVKKNWRLIDSTKAKEMDEKWKELFAEEKVLQMKKIGLFGKACNVVVKNLGK